MFAAFVTSEQTKSEKENNCNNEIDINFDNKFKTDEILRIRRYLHLEISNRKWRNTVPSSSLADFCQNWKGSSMFPDPEGKGSIYLLAPELPSEFPRRKMTVDVSSIRSV